MNFFSKILLSICILSCSICKGKRRSKESKRKAKERRDKVEKEKEKKKEQIDEIVIGEEYLPEIPLELWEEIGKHLTRSNDVACFRSMCKLSRSALPSPTNLFPLLVPTPPDCDLNVPYFITEVKFYSVELRSGQRVIVAFQQEHEGGKVRPCVVLPSGAEFDFHMVSSSLKHRPPSQSFIAKAYRLGHALPPPDSSLAQHDFEYRYISKLAEKMVLISSNADGVTNPSYARASDLSVVVLLKNSRLALLRLARSRGKNWKWDTSFCNGIFSDIVTYKGQLCAVNIFGRAFLMDSNSLKMTQVASVVTSERLRYQLIEAWGELYLASRVTEADVKVYKLSPRLKKWLGIEGLGNQAFVLCAGFNISIPRDAFSVDHGYRKMENYHMGSPSLLFSYDDEDQDGRDNGYCYIRFNTRHYPKTMFT